jgi:hypothetical protein
LSPGKYRVKGEVLRDDQGFDKMLACLVYFTASWMLVTEISEEMSVLVALQTTANLG